MILPIVPNTSPEQVAGLVVWMALLAVTAIYFVTDIWSNWQLRQKDKEIESLKARLGASKE